MDSCCWAVEKSETENVKKTGSYFLTSKDTKISVFFPQDVIFFSELHCSLNLTKLDLRVFRWANSQKLGKNEAKLLN